jgi:hypothetical protein
MVICDMMTIDGRVVARRVTSTIVASGFWVDQLGWLVGQLIR